MFRSREIEVLKGQTLMPAQGLNLRFVDLLSEAPPAGDRLLRELQRTICTMEPPQRRQILDVVRLVVRLAGENASSRQTRRK
jgi:hypothetical protein